MCEISESLNNLIVNAGIKRKSAYTTGDAAKILSTSINSIIIMCEDWIPNSNEGLECYLVGTHRRIPHHALLAWLKLNYLINRRI